MELRPLRRTVRGGRGRPEGICYLDKIEEARQFKDVDSKAKMFGLPIFKYEKLNSLGQGAPLGHTVYVLNEFEDHPMLEVLEKASNTWVLGPTALVELAMDVSLELRTKPTYSTSMYGLCFHVYCPGDKPLMRRIVKLIKWMGGFFTREPTGRTTHMISTSTLAKGYTYCFTFGVPVISPQWVEVCWQNRHAPGFKAIYIMNNYKLRPLSGLVLYFKGFKPGELQELKLLTEENGGQTVFCEELHCTHMIFRDDLASQASMSDIPAFIPYVVRDKWFWTSLDQSCRVVEDYFACFPVCKLSETQWADDTITDGSISDNSFDSFTHEMNISPDKSYEEKKSVLYFEQDKKRKTVFEELCKTEKNYLQSLEKLMRIQHLSSSGECILSKTECKIMFGNLDKIFKVHQKVMVQLENILNDWTNESLTGKVYTSLHNEIKKYYIEFSVHVDESKRVIEECEGRSCDFEKLLEGVSSGPRDEHPKDLLIRPIQRLPQVLTIFSRLLENTRDDNPDKESLEEAIKSLRYIIRMMNEGRDKSEKLQEMFKVYSLVEGCPPELVASSRHLVKHFCAQELDNSRNSLGPRLMFFLFNDVLQVAKVRSAVQELPVMFWNCSPTVDTMSSRKPLKHTATIPLLKIINLLHFIDENSKNKQIFGFHIEEKESSKGRRTVHCFQYLDSDQTSSFSGILAAVSLQLVNSRPSPGRLDPEDLILRNIPLRWLSIDTESMFVAKRRNLASKAAKGAVPYYEE